MRVLLVGEWMFCLQFVHRILIELLRRKNVFRFFLSFFRCKMCRRVHCALCRAQENAHLRLFVHQLDEHLDATHTTHTHKLWFIENYYKFGIFTVVPRELYVESSKLKFAALKHFNWMNQLDVCADAVNITFYRTPSFTRILRLKLHYCCRRWQSERRLHKTRT